MSELNTQISLRINKNDLEALRAKLKVQENATAIRKAIMLVVHDVNGEYVDIATYFYSTKQVAKILNVSVSKIKKMCTNREIAAIKIGRVWRIPKTFIDDYYLQKYKYRDE